MSVFSKVLKSGNKRKTLGDVMIGSASKYLGPGKHDCTVKAVDTSSLDVKGYAVLTYLADGPEGLEYNENIFPTNKAVDDMSLPLKSMISRCIPDAEAFETFCTVADKNASMAFQLFTGLKVRLHLERGAGYFLQVDANKKFAAFIINEEGDTGKEPVTAYFEKLEDARDAAEAQGFEKSYLNIDWFKTEPLDVDSNISIFNSAVTARETAQSAQVATNAQLAGTSAGSSLI